jgi:hypothetical protein
MFFLIILSSVLNRLFLQFLTLLEDRFFASEVYIITPKFLVFSSIVATAILFSEFTHLRFQRNNAVFLRPDSMSG